MKTGHFEGRIALSAVRTAQRRDEHIQREPATFDFDIGGAWLVAPADCARELDLHRETVGKYLRLARSKPAISTPGSPAGRQSLCQPWQAQIEAAVSVALSAQRIYQGLVGDYGFSGSYQAVKRFVRQLRQTQPIQFVRMEMEPGVEAQVDFGQGAWVMVDGKRKRPHLFRIVLSHSRKGYNPCIRRSRIPLNPQCVPVLAESLNCLKRAKPVRIVSTKSRSCCPTMAANRGRQWRAV